MINSWYYTIDGDAIKRDNDKCDITVYRDAIKWDNYKVMTLINRDSINRNIDKVMYTTIDGYVIKGTCGLFHKLFFANIHYILSQKYFVESWNSNAK